MIWLNSNLSIEGGGYSNDKNIKLAILNERKKSSDNKRFKDIRHSLSSLPNPLPLASQISNHQRNRNFNLYPYESQQLGGKKN